MKTINLLAISIFSSVLGFSQTPIPIISTTDNVKRIAAQIRSEIPPIGDQNLVSQFTFQRSFSKSFSQIVSIDNASKGDIAYATLALDKAGGTFEFSPFTFRSTDLLNLYLNGNVHAKGALAKDGTSSLFEGDEFAKEWQVGFTINILLNNSNRYNMHSPSIIENQFDRYQHSFIDNIETTYSSKINVSQASSPTEVITNLEILKDPIALEKAMRTAYSDLEEKLAKGFWTSNFTQWVSLMVDGGYSSRKVLTPSTLEISDKKIGAFSGQLAYNGYFQRLGRLCNHHFYISAPISVIRESSLSDLTPQTWNTIRPSSSATKMLIEKEESVYIVDGDYQTGYSKSAGLQALYLIELKSFAVGVNTSVRYKRPFNTSDESGRPANITQNYGVIFPLRNKEGARLVNIEIFYSKKANVDRDSKGNKEFWGLRFAIPILSLSK